ncbi:MAG: sigma-70 family RNA polymerase sigma factor [Elusimicrobia bacterium]|nr:sigma-70 family RNA polymerase sigma factor [Elusimicrobiota bacterium]
MSKLTPDDLVRGHLDGVYALALRLTGNASDAWDLTQESMLRAIRFLPGFRGECAASTWLYRITVNTWKNRSASAPSRWWSRLVPLEAAVDGAGAAAPDAVDPAPGPETAAHDSDQREEVQIALAALPPEDRAALQLRELEDKSYEEIATILEVPVGTVKSRLHRARRKLCEALRQYERYGS